MPGGVALGEMDTWVQLVPLKGFAGYPWAETIDGRRRLFYVVSTQLAPAITPRGPVFQHRSTCSAC